MNRTHILTFDLAITTPSRRGLYDTSLGKPQIFNTSHKAAIIDVKSRQSKAFKLFLAIS